MIMLSMVVSAENWSSLMVKYSQRLQLLVTTRNTCNPASSYSESNCPAAEIHAGIR